MCPRGENTQGLLPWVQTLIWTNPRPPRVLSEFLHEGPRPFHLTSGPPKRGPSLQTSKCPWSLLSVRIGIWCRHVARGHVTQAFGWKQARSPTFNTGGWGVPCCTWGMGRLLTGRAGSNDHSTCYRYGSCVSDTRVRKMVTRPID